LGGWVVGGGGGDVVRGCGVRVFAHENKPPKVGNGKKVWKRVQRPAGPYMPKKAPGEIRKNI